MIILSGKTMMPISDLELVKVLLKRRYRVKKIITGIA